MNGFSFRFRGRITRLLTLYRLFQEHPGTGLHPATIAREAGMSIVDVDERLRRTPELFVRLPQRKDGITRYRLTSAISALTEDEVRAKLEGLARRESLMLYAFMTFMLLLFAVMLILVSPAPCKKT